MRVAYICSDPGVPVFGTKGSSVHVQEVTRALLRHGADVTLFANRFDGESPADLSTLRTVALPRAPKGDPASRERRALEANDALTDALAGNGPFDLIYERYSLWSYAGMEFAREHEIPGVLEVNAPLIEEQAAHRDLVDRASAEQVARRAFAAASVLTPVSTQVAAYLEGFACTSGKLLVTPNGVNPERFPVGMPPAIAQPAGTFTVGFVGTLKRWHGLPVLIDVFDRLYREHDSTRLLVVGDGECREEMERDLMNRGLDAAVRFTGAVPPEAVPSYLASMDVGVAPYPEGDNFYFSPLKLFEYMAAGLPVVASDIGQIRSAVEHGRTGLLCAPGDADAFVRSIAVVRDNPETRSRLGAAAREHVMRNCTWDGIVKRVLETACYRSPIRVGS